MCHAKLVLTITITGSNCRIGEHTWKSVSCHHDHVWESHGYNEDVAGGPQSLGEGEEEDDTPVAKETHQPEDKENDSKDVGDERVLQGQT